MAKLPSTATIKDIIAALQQMECINQKTDLAATVGSPASASDAVATIITKLQNAKNSLAANLTAKGQSATGTESLQSLANKVNSLPVKKWATVTATVEGGGGNSTVTVSGLTFKPSLIIVKHRNGANNGDFWALYFANFPNAYDTVLTTISAITDGSQDTYNAKNNTANGGYINSSGFKLFIQSSTPGTQATCWIYE
ncbi:hypothetical protein FOI68_17075 [Brevibacillus sp. LEMMJ03]|uniref:hypothetical protein n=1 Tax=Brevibacillus sp. LEMMJ03 TaxID=2595056 RepID=UPI00117EF0E4|nr:hypothetical protein [Brevibacillus sp. LEMMJ03]TRY24365.1 hypothetical protein FOI68_17075 [Brevibacillus sp. LEMMJ03]